MKRNLEIILYLMLLGTYVQAQPDLWMKEHLPYGEPEITYNVDAKLIIREGYVLLYDNDRHVPLWVSYRLDPIDISGDIDEMYNFQEDPELSHQGVSISDYIDSQYDRGFLAVPEDMKKNIRTLKESYYLSNIVMQSPNVSKGCWMDLNNIVRSWLPAKKQLIVMAGPCFVKDKEPMRIGKGIAVPPFLWKIILDKKEDHSLTAIGFVIPNDICESIGSCIQNVDTIEEWTGLNIFPDIPDQIQNRLEANVTISDWPLSKTSQDKNPNTAILSSPQRSSTSVNSTPRNNNDVYISSKGKKYHRKSCRTISKSTSIQAVGKKQAISAGYSDCGVCNP